MVKNKAIYRAAGILAAYSTELGALDKILWTRSSISLMASIPAVRYGSWNFRVTGPLLSLREVHYSHRHGQIWQPLVTAPTTLSAAAWPLRGLSGSSLMSQRVLPGPQATGALAKSVMGYEGGHHLEDGPANQSVSSQQESASSKQQRELHIVNTAVRVNVAIFVAKVGTWLLTSSGAILAEALHSLADIVNQMLLRQGVQQSRRAPTRQHPYGFHREKYIYALMSAVGVFCIGSGASVVHGIQSLFAPPALEHMGYSLAVLGISAVGEFYSLRLALGALRLGAAQQKQGLWTYLMSSRDPTTAAVLAEDAGAVAGLGIAGMASYLTWITGDPVYDAVGSIAVGMLMGAVAVTLIRNNKRFLIGQAMRPDMHAAIITHLKGDPMVLSVIDPKSEEIGDGVYRFKAEIQWSGDRVVHKYLGSLGRDSLYGQIREAACISPGVPSGTLRDAMDLAMMEFGRGVIRTVGEEIDRLEAELRAICPGLRYVDLETDRGRTDSSSLECLIEGEPQQDPSTLQSGDENEGTWSGVPKAVGT